MGLVAIFTLLIANIIVCVANRATVVLGVEMLGLFEMNACAKPFSGVTGRSRGGLVKTMLKPETFLLHRNMTLRTWLS